MSRLVSIVALLAAACGSGGSHMNMPDAAPLPPDAHIPTFDECAASDQSFVRQATLAVLGRRPLSEGEVDVYVALLQQVTALSDKQHAEQVVVQALARTPEFADRWSKHFMDKLLVDRIDGKSLQGCYGARVAADDMGQLATMVKGAPPNTDGGVKFTMLDLVRSSLALDDLSPVYRAHLFAMTSVAIDAANVPDDKKELARRADSGQSFDAAYLHRDIVCLGCHNSEFSVTYRMDPATNRHWPMPGLPEKALYDMSKGTAPDAAHAMFRYDGFVAQQGFGDTGSRPWGWTGDCGEFHRTPSSPDPAPVAALFGTVRGNDKTIYDLEAALHHGMDTLATTGVVLDADGNFTDPDSAFAWLVSATIVEGVWQEVMGTPLTVPNYFPRNLAQRDLLTTLTTHFVASHYSLRTLLGDIVTSDYFNRLPPEAACGAGPYDMPNVFDPWVIGDDDPAKRLNGAGDGVFALSPHVLLSAAYAALAWTPPAYESFPEPSQCDQLSCGQLTFACNSLGSCCPQKVAYCDHGGSPPDPNEEYIERYFQRGIGVYLKSTEHGFRGLDFQARLEWEDRFATCDKPSFQSGMDFLDALAAAAATQGTVRDVVAAMKDRFVGDPHIDDAMEKPALEAIFGASLDSPAAGVTGLSAAERRYCGALLGSPQFLLGGIAPPDTAADAAEPLLTPSAQSFASVCATVAMRGVPGYTVACSDTGLSVTAAP